MPNSERVQRVLAGASELPPEQRAAYLDAACRGDAALRGDAESLLRSLDEAGRFLSEPTNGAAAAAATTAAAPLREGPGTQIGRYKLLQLIGEGGFGSVFMAEQQSPVIRRVAVKIIKLGMDTRQVIARFEAERQALAMMDHPNIAKVLDAGATETGRPYFVMELVPGDPITEYCDKNNLTVPERLELFDQVCRAVQHAHQKGIIHRDIKPTNVLVSTQDGRPHAKVIDFGIAKATAARLTEKTLFTEHRALIGTPQYMSPEQAEGGMDIDTRTDVYALGVLLYELLTGSTPFDGARLRSAAYAEMQRIIREDEPPKPSTRLSSLDGAGRAPTDQTLATIAAHRRLDPRRLSPLVRGELDWIVMKALEKDRARRYETASGLAMDVQRYLSGEAVVAAPPSRSYRIRKFVRRNKGPVAAASLVMAALVLGVIGTSVGVFRAERARKAETEQRTKAEAINDFLRTALQSSDPNHGGRQGMLVADAVANAVALLDEGEFTAQPEVEAGLRLTIAEILNGNGRSAEALPLAERALAIYRQLHAGDHSDVATGLDGVARVLRTLGRAADAQPLLVQALAMRQRLVKGDHASVASSLNNLATVLGDLGRMEEAETMFVRSLEMKQRLFKGDDPDVAAALNNVAYMRLALGHFAEAEPLYMQALEMNRRLHKGDHPAVAMSLDNLAVVRSRLGRDAEAELLDRQALEMYQRLFKGDHLEVATCLNNLGFALQALQRPADAERLFEQALGMRQRLLIGDQPDTVQVLDNLAAVQVTLGRFADAEPLYLQALEMNQRLHKGDDPKVANSLNCLAYVRQALDRAAAAEPLYVQALEMNRRLHKGDDADVARSLNNLAGVWYSLGRAAAAEPLYVQALEMNRRLFTGDHASVAQSLSNLANTWRDLGRAADALPLHRDAIAMFGRLFKGDAWQTANSLRGLALTLAKLNHLPEALDNAQQGAAMAHRTLPEGHPVRTRCDGALAEIKEQIEAAGAAPEAAQPMPISPLP